MGRVVTLLPQRSSTTSQLIRKGKMGGSVSRASQPTSSIEDERIETIIMEELTRILERHPALLLSINNTEIVLNTNELIRTGCAEDIILYLVGKGFKVILCV
jgi:hypothetical protein